MLKSLPALVEHTRAANADCTSSTEEKMNAAGIVKRMDSWNFLIEIATLHNVLECLQSCSLCLQKLSASVINAKIKFGPPLSLVHCQR